jgi:serine/threonine protein kinase
MRCSLLFALPSSFGEVYKATFRGSFVAVKTMQTVDQNQLDRFQQEIHLMSGLRHQNIVAMIG